MRATPVFVLMVALAGCPQADPPRLMPTAAVGSRVEAQTIASADPDEDDYAKPFGPDKEVITVTIRNECHRVVRVYLGDQPIPGQITFITMNGRSQISEPMMPGDQVWMLDENEEPVARARVERDTTEVVIDDSCEEIRARRVS